MICSSIDADDFAARVGHAAKLDRPLEVQLRPPVPMTLAEWHIALTAYPDAHERFATACDYMRAIYGEVFVEVKVDRIVISGRPRAELQSDELARQSIEWFAKERQSIKTAKRQRTGGFARWRS
jgi:hypothetical protein